ncbi:hypothetical protein PIB30_070897 [Stylosanthes scabra]|uniref:Protein PHYTOCHROME KINASE SUBSTRATE 1-like n=1 Tax=Stylosanthes scabra TaxID=79078 RepID=A0ABU6ZMA0_9FABA|nr:hypothetical protein [Stylosanthes scabra]
MHHLQNNTYEQQEAAADSSSQHYNTKKEGEPLHLLLHHGIVKEEDSEIGVFEATKYFNGGGGGGEVLVSQRRKQQHHHHYYQKKDEQKSTVTGGRLYNRRSSSSKFGTPSVRSESSWNSQSALLQSSMKESSRNKNNNSSSIKVQRNMTSFLANFGCKCSCSDKDSVDISNNAKSSKKNLNNPAIDANNNNNNNHRHDSVKETKPHAEAEISMNRETGLLALKKIQIQQETEKARKSLEVFGSPILDHCRSKSLSFDKRFIRHSSWDDDHDHDDFVLQKIEEIDLAKNGNNGNYNDDDCESDASSDLFEIDSLTGKANNNRLLVRPIRTSCDVVSFCASPTPTSYAPSETSIEWSVVTASALDYSAMSDWEDQRSVATVRSPARPQQKAGGKVVCRRRPGMLLGCKSQKAVGVASDTVPASEKPSGRKLEGINQVTRFQEETKQGRPPMQQRSHSPHASQLLCI